MPTTTVLTATITIKAMATGLTRILSSHFAGGANIERSGVIVPQIIPAPAAGRAARWPLACSPHPEDLHGFQCGPESQGGRECADLWTDTTRAPRILCAVRQRSPHRRWTWPAISPNQTC